MKRDMDLIRRILLAMEESDERPFSLENTFPEDDKQSIMYQAYLLLQAGWIEGYDMSPTNRSEYDVMVVEITWEGHEFLDSVRDDSTWKKVKQTVADKGGSFTTSLLQGLALAAAKGQLGL